MLVSVVNLATGASARYWHRAARGQDLFTGAWSRIDPESHGAAPARV